MQSRDSLSVRRRANPMEIPVLATTILVAGCVLVAPTTIVASEPAARETEITAGEQAAPTAGVRKFRKRQQRPIRLGVSGGNARDVFIDGDSGYCVSGTLGGLVLKNGTPHILSNNHVLAQENDARKGDPVTQPGLIDNACQDQEEDYVAHLSAYKKLKFGGAKRNKVDAAIAEVVAGAVDPRGTIQGIGVPGDQVLEPFLGMKVKKAGRSSGLTRGTVILVGATVSVFFGTPEEPKTAKFVNQLMVTPNKRTFVKPGDSGSVVFYDSKDCPEWVGLLFAGSSDGWGIVNPIKPVFKALKKLKPRGRVAPIGCQPATSVIVAPVEEPAVRPDDPRIERQLRAGRRIVERRDDELLALDGVVGLGLGFGSGDAQAVTLDVLVTDGRADTLDRIPSVLDGMPTRIVETGRFFAY